VAALSVLITGATGGVGYATARRYLADGARVLVHGPTPPDAGQAAQRLVAAGADPARVSAVAADFRRLDEVAALAEVVSGSAPRLDVLIHNAAVLGPGARVATVDGNELTFQVNYLAPVLLTRLLVPQLRAARGRVIAVSSTLHHSGHINWSDPQRVKLYAAVPAYAQSKLALTMFVRALAGRQPGITSISVHPGIVEGGLLSVYSHVGSSVEDAATVLATLGSPEVQPHNGAYYDGIEPAVPARLVDSPDAVRRLWALTTRLLGRDRLGRATAA
jgi:NAD(P)-dependent dehydrogenase (short-subunit alcohol dehydrogenase family)